MRELGGQKKRNFCAGFLGQIVSVLVEEKTDKATGLCRGFSRNYLPVMLPHEPKLTNREMNVKLEGVHNGWLLGRLMTGAALNTVGDHGAAAHAF